MTWSSVAVTLVTIFAWRGSFAGLLQLVRQLRVAAVCPVRLKPGNCSQHSVVRYVRPTPLITSSLPFSAMVAVPPGSPPPDGFGPQAAPQSPTFQLAVSAVADHLPSSDGDCPSARPSDPSTRTGRSSAKSRGARRPGA